MTRSVAKRVLQFIPVLIGITILSFFLIRISPGNPASIRAAAGGVTPDKITIEKYEKEMGLNKPIYEQYFDWLGKIVKGDFGKSYITDENVSDKLKRALPYTLYVAFASMSLTLLISIPLGIYCAEKKNSRLDKLINFIAFSFNAIPSFVVGLVLLFIFAYRLRIIPVLVGTNPIGAILPSITLALVMSARFIRQIRAATLDELSKEYVASLRARGISERVILFNNVFRNILIIIVTLTGISVGSLLGGTVIVEVIFNWPGVGYLMTEALQNRDYPIVQAFVVWSAICYMIVNMITDISYTWIDPKIKNM